jgi:hypothetical protein
MAQAREHARLAFESLAARIAIADVPWQDLESHRPAESHIDRPIHLSHATVPQRRLNHVRAQSMVCCEH